MSFAMDFARHKGIKLVDRIDHFVKPVSDEALCALYEGDEGDLMLESCSIEDIETTLFLGIAASPDMMMEAITSTSVRLKNTMKAFCRVLNAKTQPVGVTASDAEISKPRKSGLVAVMTARIPLSDGQSVSVVFHAPDNDPMKINPSDTLIAFRFLLNSRDITHVVAPSGGNDLSLDQATMALANVIERNSEKFKAAQAEKSALKAEIEAADIQAEGIEAEIAKASDDIESLGEKITATGEQNKNLESRIKKQDALQELLRKELETLSKSASPEPIGNSTQIPEEVKRDVDSYNRLKALDGSFASSIRSSAVTIGRIDMGLEKGYDRSLFVNSIVGKIKTQHKNGNQDVVDAALDFLDAISQIDELPKPIITARNGVWKLRSQKDETGPGVGEGDDAGAQTDDTRILNVGDIYTLNDYSWRVESISPTAAFVRDIDSQETARVSKSDAERQGLVFAGMNEPDVALGKTESIVKGLDLSAHIGEFRGKPSLSFDGQDAIYDALRAEGYDIDNARIEAQRIRNGFNMGDYSVISAPQQEHQEEGDNTVIEANFSYSDLLRRVNDEQAAMIETLKGQGFDFGITPEGTYWYSQPSGERKMVSTIFSEFITALEVFYQGHLSDVIQGQNQNPKNQSHLRPHEAPISPTNGNSINKMKASDLDAGSYVIEWGDSDYAKITKQDDGSIEMYVSIDSGLHSGTERFANFSDVKRRGMGFYNEMLDDHESNLVNDRYTQSQLDAATNAPVIPLPTSGEPDAQQLPSTASAIDDVRNILDDLAAGLISLAQAKKQVGAVDSVPKQLQSHLKEAQASRRKTTFLELGNAFIKDAMAYDPDAPRVKTSNGGKFDFNSVSYDVIDEISMFGRSLNEVAKTHPEKVISYIDEISYLNSGDKADIKQAAKAYYMPEQAPVVEPTVDERIAKKVEDAEYTFGKDSVKYFYGLRMRPFSGGAQPDGNTLYLNAEEAAVKFPDANPTDIRHGLLAYKEPLPAQQISSYELVDLQASNNGVEMDDEEIMDYYVREVADQVASAMGDATVEQINEMAGKGNRDGEIQKAWRKHPHFELKTKDPELFAKLRYAMENATPAMYDVALRDSFGIDDATQDEPEIAPESTPEPQQEISPAMAAVEEVKALVASEGLDSDTYLARMEKAFGEIEAAGQLDEYEGLMNDAADKLTRIMEAEEQAEGA